MVGPTVLISSVGTREHTMTQNDTRAVFMNKVKVKIILQVKDVKMLQCGVIFTQQCDSVEKTLKRRQNLLSNPALLCLGLVTPHKLPNIIY